MSDPYEQSPVPIYVTLEGDVMLDATPAAAWPILLDVTAWQNFTAFDHVSGPPDQVGELKLLRKDAPGAGKSPYFARTVKLETNKRVIWKIYREEHSQDDANLGIIQFSLTAFGAQTRLNYSVLYEFNAPCCSKAEWRKLNDTYNQNVRTLLGGAMPELQSLIKERVGR